MERELSENQPPLFFEYATGSSTEKAEICAQLQLLKLNCEQETDAAWYEWKHKLLEPLFVSFSENASRVQRDAGYLAEFSEQLDVMHKIASEYSDELALGIAENEQLYLFKYLNT